MTKRLPFRIYALASLAALALAAALWPSEARALDLHWSPEGDGHGQWVASSPGHPRRYYVMTPPPAPAHRVRVHVHRSPPPRTTVHVRHVQPSEPPPSPEPRKGPYDTDGIVVVGAGAGGLVLTGDETQVAPSYRLQLGLAVGAAEFALRADLAPSGLDVPTADGDLQDARLYTVGASFNYRFIEGAVVHPVAGAGIETVILAPEQGETGTAFAATLRAGLEFAYPISDGALALGIDGTGHLPFATADGYPVDADPMVTFGAYMSYRF